MQGDWWSHGLSGRPKDRYSKYSSPSNTWATPASKATTPKIVTLTVQPLTENAQPFRHCNYNHSGISSAENILAQAQRRRRLNMKQKALYYGKRPMSIDAQADETDSCDLTWSNFFERHLSCNSTNSPYGGQDLNSTSSSGPVTTTTNKEVNRHTSSDDFRTLERKLEKERERRTHIDPSPPRIETKGIRFRRLSLIESYEDTPTVPYRSPKTVLGDDIPNMDLTKCNGFRASKKPETLFSRKEQQQQPLQRSPSYRNSVIRDSLASMGPSTSATLRGHSIGFGNRDGQSLRSPTHRGRMKGSMMVPHGHGNDRPRRSKYQYPDPAPGCIPAFQQRLSELSSLEGDTIRYERAKKSKKKAKQERE